MGKPFEFRQCVSILKSTGRKARTLGALREIISTVSEASLFHHTCQYFLKGHTQEYTNDFAHWAGEGLEERALSEHLSNVDPFAFKDTEALRVELLRVLDEYTEKFPAPREAMDGEEFYFNETVTLVFPLGVTATDLNGLTSAVREIDPGSIYYHFYEARRRLKGSDDFSHWVEDSLGLVEIAARIRSIDPFMHTIDGIRAHVIEAVGGNAQGAHRHD